MSNNTTRLINTRLPLFISPPLLYQSFYSLFFNTPSEKTFVIKRTSGV